MDSAREKLERTVPMTLSFERLQEETRASIGLEEILWDCGWNKEHRLAAYGLLKDAKSGWADYEKGGEGLEGFHTTLLHDNKKPWVVANIDKWWGIGGIFIGGCFR